jgi:hypothetical protein
VINETKSKKAITFAIAFFISCATAIYYYGQLADNWIWVLIMCAGGVGLECYHIVLALELKNLAAMPKAKRWQVKAKRLAIVAQYSALAFMAVMSTFMTLLTQIEKREARSALPRAQVKSLEAKVAYLESDLRDSAHANVGSVINANTNEWAAIHLARQSASFARVRDEKITTLIAAREELAELRSINFSIKSGFHSLAKTINAPGKGNLLMVLSALFFSLMLVIAMGRTVGGAQRLWIKKSKKKKKHHKQQLQFYFGEQHDQ